MQSLSKVKGNKKEKSNSTTNRFSPVVFLPFYQFFDHAEEPTYRICRNPGK